MSTLYTSQLSFTEGELSPDQTVEKLKKCNANFESLTHQVGGGLLTTTFDELEDYFKAHRSPELAGLPELVSVGEIGLEMCDHKATEIALASMFVPALVKLRESCGVIYEMHNGNYELAQLNLLRLLLTLEQGTSKVTVVDLNGFGSNVKILRNAVPDCELITSHEEFQKLMGDLELNTRDRIDQMHPLCHWIFEHNTKHRDRKVPYHFVYIADVDTIFEETELRKFNRLLNNFNAAKAGIYFTVCDPNSNLTKINIASNHFVKVVEIDERLEIIDPNGLNTTSSSKHAILEVKKEQYKDSTLEAVIRLTRSYLSEVKQTIIEISTDQSDLYSGSSGAGISVPIGKNTKGELVDFTLGKPAIVNNALIGGAVGTGKTVLLHAIAMGLAQKYSPDEVALSILDYKEGTEFSGYRSLPHLFALSAGPNVDFGVELLGELSAVLTQRGIDFKKVGATNLEDYRRKSKKVMPRHVVIIDEFQVLLTNERLGQKAQQTLEDLVRRGRSFGINFILSSQSLADYSLSQALSSNVGLRLCLRLSSNECGRFLDIGNEVPTTFKTAGKALINDGEGRLDSNRLFQVAYYSENEIKKIIARLPRFKKSDHSFSPYIYDDDDTYSLQDLSQRWLEVGGLCLGAKQALVLCPYALPLDLNLTLVLVDTESNAANGYSTMLKHQLEQEGFSIFESNTQELDDINGAILDSGDDRRRALIMDVTGEIDMYDLGLKIKEELGSMFGVIILKVTKHSDDLLDSLTEPHVIYFDEESYRSKYSFSDDLEGAILGSDMIAIMKDHKVKFVGKLLTIN